MSYWDDTPPTWQPDSEDAYHEAKEPGGGLLHGSSMLRLALDNPALYYARYVTGEEPVKQSRPMIVGSMVDDAILQPEAFAVTYVRQPESIRVRKGADWEAFLEKTLKEQVEKEVGFSASGEEWDLWFATKGAPEPKKPRNGKVADDKVRWGPEWVEFLEARLRRTIVRSADWDLAAHIGWRIEGNPMAHSLLMDGGYPQACHKWQDPNTGIWCKLRIDNATETNIRPAAVDLKVWNVVDPVNVAKRVWNDGIHLQMALYEEGFFDLWGVHPDIFLVIAHSEPPYEVAVYQIPTQRTTIPGYGDRPPRVLEPEFLIAGRQDICRARESLKARYQADEWRNDWERDIQQLEPPAWANHG